MTKIPGLTQTGQQEAYDSEFYLAILASQKNPDDTPFAQNVVDGGGLRPLGYQQITALTTVQSLTVPTGATLAIIEAEAQNVRWRDDGTNPTASVGMRLLAGGDLSYNANLSAFKAIQEIAGAILNISYYGPPA